MLRIRRTGGNEIRPASGQFPTPQHTALPCQTAV
jgi:hypothetical protein